MTPEEAIGAARLKLMMQSPGIHVVVTTVGISLVEVERDGKCFQLKLVGDYPKDGELSLDRWNPECVRATLGPFSRAIYNEGAAGGLDG